MLTHEWRILVLLNKCFGQHQINQIRRFYQFLNTRFDNNAAFRIIIDAKILADEWGAKSGFSVMFLE